MSLDKLKKTSDDILSNALTSMGNTGKMTDIQRNLFMKELFPNEDIHPVEDNFYNALNLLPEMSRDIVRRRLRGEDFLAISSRYYLLREEAEQMYNDAIEVLRTETARCIFMGEQYSVRNAYLTKEQCDKIIKDAFFGAEIEYTTNTVNKAVDMLDHTENDIIVSRANGLKYSDIEKRYNLVEGGGRSLYYKALANLRTERLRCVLKGEPYTGINTKSKISEIGVSTRVINGLGRIGIKTIDEVCNADYETIVASRNLGSKSIEELYDKLKENGFEPVWGDKVRLEYFSDSLLNPSVKDVIDLLNKLPKDAQFMLNNSTRLSVSFDMNGGNTVYMKSDNM